MAVRAFLSCAKVSMHTVALPKVLGELLRPLPVSAVPVRNSSHDFNTVEFPIPLDKVEILMGNNKENLDRIQRFSGAVVRLKQNQPISADTKQFLIAGNQKQVQHAMSLLKNTLQGKGMERGASKPGSDADAFIWQSYRRNFKGQFAPPKTRKKCIRCGGKDVSGNPCPLCKLKLEKDYQLTYSDTNLLNQFVSPHTWEILPAHKTGLCQQQQKLLVDCITKARNFGYMPFTLPLPTDHVEPHKPAGIPTNRKVRVKM